jgi:uncharacterized membrane protein
MISFNVFIAICIIVGVLLAVGAIYAIVYSKPEGEKDNAGCGKIFIRIILITIALVIGALILDYALHPKG